MVFTKYISLSINILELGGGNIKLDFWGDKKEQIGRDAFYNDLVITSLCNSHVHSPKTARITVRPPPSPFEVHRKGGGREVWECRQHQLIIYQSLIIITHG